jgi:hypothetical protein
VEERSVVVSAGGMLVVMVGGTAPLVHSDTCRGGLLVSDAGWVTMVLSFGRVSGIWLSIAS